MAVTDVFNGLKKKLEGFLYAGEAEPQQPRQPQPRQEDMGAPAPDASFTQPQYGYYQEAPQQVPMYQQPQQQMYPPQGYQQPQQPQYHADYRQQGHQPNQQGSRFGQKKDNVVDIGDYQQKEASAAPQQEQPQQVSAVATRVVCARGMVDCRIAITLLRNGDAVLVTMENVKDPAEMRRLVDTLSGACYSLNASITKVSRFGVYLLAPQQMPVFADQMINQMNGARPQPQMQQRPMYAPQQQAYQPQGYQQQYDMQQNPYQQGYSYQPRQQGEFTQRTAVPQEQTGDFYARPRQQAVQMPGFASQNTNAGYVPDDVDVAE